MELSDIEEIVNDEDALQEAITDCLELLSKMELPALGNDKVVIG